MTSTIRRLTFWAAATAIAVAAFGAGGALAASPKALILGSTVSGSPSVEEQVAVLEGLDVTVVDDAQWGAMTASDFAAYRVLIIGDPPCGDTVDGAAGANASVWQPVVMASGGNRAVIGTDPVFHLSEGSTKLIRNGIAFAGAVAGATGAYITISCSSQATDNGTPFSFLDGLTSGPAGSFTTEYPPCSGDISIVAQSGPTTGLNHADLSNWGCSVHQSFKTWASDWTPLAIAKDSPTKPYCANDVDTGTLACGAPYILVAGTGIAVASSIGLAPRTAVNPVATSHTVTATIVVDGAPVAGKTVTFLVENGPGAGETGTATTDADGKATFTYTNNGTPGTDTISASFVNDAGAIEKATAVKTWTTGAATVASIEAVCAGDVLRATATASGDAGNAFTLTLQHSADGTTFSDTDQSTTITIVAGETSYQHVFDVSSLSATAYRVVSGGVQSNVISADSCGPGNEIPEASAALLLPLSILGTLGIAALFYLRRRNEGGV